MHVYLHVCSCYYSYSKTMLLFFVPQVFNFVYSVPQLFHCVPCPRHRMPRYDADTDLLYPSMVQVVDESVRKSRVKQILGRLSLRVFYALGLLRVELPTGDTTAASAGESPARTHRRRTAPARPVTEDNTQQRQWWLERGWPEGTQVNNLTLLNLLLVWFGPMSEGRLCSVLMLVQFVFGTLLTFLIRYCLVYLVYND